jgi:hypothetical protein
VPTPHVLWRLRRFPGASSGRISHKPPLREEPTAALWWRPCTASPKECWSWRNGSAARLTASVITIYRVGPQE